MKYKNAREILPNKLLLELQQYVSGETLYIPRVEMKKSWGETSGARTFYRERNEKIREAHKCGKGIEKLAEQFNLSIDSIRKIIY